MLGAAFAFGRATVVALGVVDGIAVALGFVLAVAVGVGAGSGGRGVALALAAALPDAALVAAPFGREGQSAIDPSSVANAAASPAPAIQLRLVCDSSASRGVGMVRVCDWLCGGAPLSRTMRSIEFRAELVATLSSARAKAVPRRT